ncbi:MAG: hypothetical protein U1C74_01685 [Phenylobacterium sp.]|nr:hypothetical protein [Phenylobacterium sp.]
MSEANDIESGAADRDDARLESLADLELPLAARVQRAAMETDDADAIVDLTRGFVRVARSLRQTLALKAKLRRDRIKDAQDAAAARRAAFTLDPDLAARCGRADAIAEAVRQAADEAGYEPLEAETLAERFFEEACDWREAPDFLVEDLDAQILRALRHLSLDDDPADDDEDDDGGEGRAGEGRAGEGRGGDAWGGVIEGQARVRASHFIPSGPPPTPWTRDLAPPAPQPPADRDRAPEWPGRAPETTGGRAAQPGPDPWSDRRRPEPVRIRPDHPFDTS